MPFCNTAFAEAAEALAEQELILFSVLASGNTGQMLSVDGPVPLGQE